MENEFDSLSELSDKADRVARFGGTEEIDRLIFEEILSKANIGLQPTSILEIGVGCGRIAEFWNDKRLAKSSNINRIYFLDTEKVLAKLEATITVSEHVSLLKGVFPDDCILKKIAVVGRMLGGFDRVIAYSVFHYINDKLGALEKAFQIASDQCTVLIGDLPNIDKKITFLESDRGKKIDREYRARQNMPEVEYDQLLVELYAKKRNAGEITNSLISEMEELSSAYGFELKRENQGGKLPFCETREDLVFKRG